MSSSKKLEFDEKRLSVRVRSQLDDDNEEEEGQVGESMISVSIISTSDPIPHILHALSFLLFTSLFCAILLISFLLPQLPSTQPPHRDLFPLDTEAGRDSFVSATPPSPNLPPPLISHPNIPEKVRVSLTSVRDSIIRLASLSDRAEKVNILMSLKMELANLMSIDQ